METLQLVQLHSSRDPRFAAVHDIFTKGFAKQERGRSDRLSVFTDTGFYRIYAALMDSEQVVGMAAILPISPEPDAWLEYMAVRSDKRGLGIGSAVMRWLCRSGHGYSGLFFEVHKPRDASDSADAMERNRRISFYRRHGARLLDNIPYRMWTSDGGIPMHLMFCPVAGAEMPDHHAIAKRLERSLALRRAAYMKQ